MGQAIRASIDGPEKSERVRRGQARLEFFTWKHTAELTLQVFDEAVASSPSVLNQRAPS
jgi:glycosyltransferase involved in cell wall biosynthesis